MRWLLSCYLRLPVNKEDLPDKTCVISSCIIIQTWKVLNEMPETEEKLLIFEKNKVGPALAQRTQTGISQWISSKNY